MGDENLTPLQITEKEALTGDGLALTRLVSAVRRYRQIVQDTLAKRYRDGECDAVALSNLEREVEEIENDGTEGR